MGSAQDIITSSTLYVTSVKGRSFQNNKWSFKMFLQNCDLPLKSKVKIDLKYKDTDSTATCSLDSNNILTCIPDIDTQNSADTFTITKNKNLGTVTYSSPEENLVIQDSKDLNLIKAKDLMLKNSKWEFKLEITTNSLKAGDTINVDIKLNGNKKKAECTYTTDLLICSVDKVNNSDRIILINDALNTDFIWLNSFDEIELYVVYSISYINVFGGFDGSKWRFVMKYTKTNDNDNLIGNYASLETSVDSTASTARCKITEKFLECEAMHKPQTKDDVLKIKTSTPTEGSITITNDNIANSEIVFSSLPLTMTFSEINNFNYENGKITFILKGNLKENEVEEIGEKSITKINLLIKKQDPTNNLVNVNTICDTNAISNKNGPATLTCVANAEMNKNEDDVEIEITAGKSVDVTFDSITENIKVYDHLKKSANNEGKNNGVMIKINYLLSLFLLLLL